MTVHDGSRPRPGPAARCAVILTIDFGGPYMPDLGDGRSTAEVTNDSASFEQVRI